MAVPKKKISKGVTRRRHKTFLRIATGKIKGLLNIVKCTDCGSDRMNHHACPTCGKYNGKQVVDKSKELDKVTTIKA